MRHKNFERKRAEIMTTPEIYPMSIRILVDKKSLGDFRIGTKDELSHVILTNLEGVRGYHVLIASPSGKWIPWLPTRDLSGMAIGPNKPPDLNALISTVETMSQHSKLQL